MDHQAEKRGAPHRRRRRERVPPGREQGTDPATTMLSASAMRLTMSLQPGKVRLEGSASLTCPKCMSPMEKVRYAGVEVDRCVKCNAPLEALWQICPHCATPVSTPSLPGIDDTIADSWTAPRKRAAESE